MDPSLSFLNAEQTVRRDAHVERLIQSTSGLFDIFAVQIGDRLGFCRALAHGSSLTSIELAARTGTHERYCREWLDQQTVAGIVEVVNAEDPATARRYRLPAGHAEVLTEPDSLSYLAPLAQLAVGVTHPSDSVLGAYRSGGGVSLGEYGPDFLEGQAGINRSAFLYELGAKWLTSIPQVHERLQSDPPARIADIGCNVGWSSIGMAQSYTKVAVDGFDLDVPSIERARANAFESGLNGRVAFYVREAGDPSLAGCYDVVIAPECIHDMSDPVGVLRSMRRMAGRDGVMIVGDARVATHSRPTATTWSG